ncbi:MAG TPA: hypothetical protein VGD88_05375 [Opitutaceae bacterium]
MIISSVPPAARGGGQIALKRRLEAVSDFDCLVITDGPVESDRSVKVTFPAWVQRLQRTRFARLVHAAVQFHPGTQVTSAVRSAARAYQPDIVLTVAHGLLWPLAADIARDIGRPLISMFMDWWPDLAYVPNLYRPRVEREFKRLYQRSQLAFVSSPQMQTELGSHPNAHLLYDGAAKLPPFPRKRPSAASRFRLVYVGNMSDVYADPIRQLFERLVDDSTIELQLIGAKPDWPDDILRRAKEAGVYQGTLSDEDVAAQLANADALLVVMTHDSVHARRMRTSFPSKIGLYCQAAVPLVVWAPAYSSAALWARSSQSALLVEEPDVDSLISAITWLAKSPNERIRLGQRAAECARSTFAPDHVQAVFRNSLMRIVARPDAQS